MNDLRGKSLKKKLSPRSPLGLPRSPLGLPRSRPLGLNGEPAWLRRERGSDEPAEGELFNLANDPGQTKNRIAEQADRAAAMNVLLEKYRTEGRSVARR